MLPDSSDTSISTETQQKMSLVAKNKLGRRGGLVVEFRIPEQEVEILSSLMSPCCILEQDTLPPKKYW